MSTTLVEPLRPGGQVLHVEPMGAAPVTLLVQPLSGLSPAAQAKLLRAIQEREVHPVGATRPVSVDVRVIAATHQDLEQRVKEGGFREDLFHRLNVIRLRLPALRERREDVPMLTRYFLQRSAQQLGVEPKRITEAAMAQLGQFQFPGNVRQLENICHWLTVMAPAQVIEVKDLPPEVQSPLTFEPSAEEAAPTAVLAQVNPQPTVSTVFAPAGHPLPDMGWEQLLEREALQLLSAGRNDVWDVLARQFESRLILTALSTTRGRRIEAAQRLGIGRNTITRKIQELGIDD